VSLRAHTRTHTRTHARNTHTHARACAPARAHLAPRAAVQVHLRQQQGQRQGRDDGARDRQGRVWGPGVGTWAVQLGVRAWAPGRASSGRCTATDGPAEKRASTDALQPLGFPSAGRRRVKAPLDCSSPKPHPESPRGFQVTPGQGPACNDKFTVSFFVPFEHQVGWGGLGVGGVAAPGARSREPSRPAGRLANRPCAPAPNSTLCRAPPHETPPVEPAGAQRRHGVHREPPRPGRVRRLVRRLGQGQHVAEPRVRRHRRAGEGRRQGGRRVLLHRRLRQPLPPDQQAQRGRGPGARTWGAL
jgi:hypothetical protein